jgi:hypothetical protein
MNEPGVKFVACRTQIQNHLEQFHPRRNLDATSQFELALFSSPSVSLSTPMLEFIYTMSATHSVSNFLFWNSFASSPTGLKLASTTLLKASNACIATRNGTFGPIAPPSACRMTAEKTEIKKQNHDACRLKNMPMEK